MSRPHLLHGSAARTALLQRRIFRFGLRSTPSGDGRDARPLPHASRLHFGARRPLADPVAVDLDTAVTLGLIANELLLNAPKHGFSGRPAGELTVELCGG